MGEYIDKDGKVLRKLCGSEEEYERLKKKLTSKYIKIEEAQASRDAIGNELKAMMVEEGADKMVIGEHKLSYVDVTRTSLDKARLEEKYGDLSEFTVTSTYKRFSIS